MVGFPVLEEEYSDLEDDIEIGEISRKLLSPSRKSEGPNLNKFYNDQTTWFL